MLANNTIGRNGRLGNQMFQYASLRGIAANRGFDFCVPPSSGKKEYIEHQLFEAFKLKNFNRQNIKFLDHGHVPIIEERKNDLGKRYFDEDLYNNCPEDVSLWGYFGSEKYFIAIEKSIREDFSFCDNILNASSSIIGELYNPIALHVRRTDYLHLRKEWLLYEEYYKQALKNFGNDRQVIIFSDDPIWCKKQELFSSNRFFISTNNNIVDLCLMSLCSAHIICCSTFSWWGAWLASSEKVIASKKWPDDMYPSSWICI